MSKRINCKLVYGNRTEMHLSQIIAGFQMLKEQKIINFEIAFDPGYIKEKYIHTAMIELKTDNQIISYDLSDGYQSFHDMEQFDQLLDGVDFYFKRSIDRKKQTGLRNDGKVLPLGLNYLTSCKNNPFDKYISTSANKLASIKGYYKYFRYEKRFQSEYYFSKFEHTPNPEATGYKLLFSTRLWDESKIQEEGLQRAYPNLSANEIKQLSEKWKNDLRNVTFERIEQVTALKDRFGSQFLGGVTRDAYSQKLVPHLLVSDEFAIKTNYMKTTKGNVVCIANRGLHHSIPWKLGEYVAASRAIITEPLAYEVPGDFSPEGNYLTFNNTSELLTNAGRLLEDEHLIHQMEQNNHLYYHNYVRPDSMVRNTLIAAGLTVE
jgi:hypothetical protein